MEKHDRTPSEWKKAGLPDWIYEVERELVILYSMRARREHRKDPYSARARIAPRRGDLVCDVCDGIDTPKEHGISLAWVCSDFDVTSPRCMEVVWCGLACGGEGRYCGDSIAKRVRGHLYDGPVEWFFGDAAWVRLRDLHYNYKWPHHWFDELTGHLQKMSLMREVEATKRALERREA